VKFYEVDRLQVDDEPLPEHYLTTRDHDQECRAARALARDRGQPEKCAPGCRAGQPWPTLRLLPRQRRAS